VAGWFLFLLGGLESPWIHLFFLNSAVSAMILRGPPRWIAWGLQHILLLVFQLQWLWRTDANTLNPLELGITLHVTLFVSWVLVGHMSDLMNTQSNQIFRYQALLQRQSQLKTLGALASGISHRLATPLNVALHALERIKSMTTSETKNSPHELSASITPELQSASSAIDESVKILQLFNQAQLDFQQGQISTWQEWPVWVEQATERWRQQQKRPLHLKFSIEESSETPNKPIRRILIPTVALFQALWSLLDNARDAAPVSSGENSHITVKAISEAHQVGFCIVDSGPGFPPHVLQHIGEPFLTTKSQGNGLGLFSVHLLMESLGGKLVVKNLEPHGAQVCCLWPVEQVSQEVSTASWETYYG
ncbi:MAG: HAMP domain-containing histidine kinase, partial [Bdellovibrionaceae bacterium]|nr:HAMP domain-containing histidine kinase [Pseudobdellovibrionaceae bacterium]